MSEREDQELQRYLSGDSRVSQAFDELSKAQPPAHLDATILAAAEEQAAQPTRPVWLVPAALAATITLGVGLSLQTMRSPLESSLSESDAYNTVASSEASQPTMDIAPEPAVSPPVSEQFSAPEPTNFDTQSAIREATSKTLNDLENDFDDRPPALTAPPTVAAPPVAEDAAITGLAASASHDKARTSAERSVQIEAERKRKQEGVKQTRQIPRDERKQAFAKSPPTPAPVTVPDAAPPPAAIAGYRERTNEVAPASNEQRAITSIASERDSATQPLRSPAVEATPKPELAFAPAESALQASGEVSAQTVPRRYIQSYRGKPEQVLALIRDLHERGQTDDAQQIFDAFIVDYPEFVIPEDFPLQKPPEIESD